MTDELLLHAQTIALNAVFTALEKPKMDRPRCRCDRGPEEVRCDICGETVCRHCIEPAVNPVTFEAETEVCCGCRDRIWEINRALEYYAQEVTE